MCIRDSAEGLAGNFRDAGAEFFAVVIDLFHGHGGNDLAELAFAQALHLSLIHIWKGEGGIDGE